MLVVLDHLARAMLLLHQLRVATKQMTDHSPAIGLLTNIPHQRRVNRPTDEGHVGLAVRLLDRYTIDFLAGDAVILNDMIRGVPLTGRHRP